MKSRSKYNIHFSKLLQTVRGEDEKIAPIEQNDIQGVQATEKIFAGQTILNCKYNFILAFLQYILYKLEKLKSFDLFKALDSVDVY